MREIKFRVWCKVSQRYSEKHWLDVATMQYEHGFNIFDDDLLVVQQYTGLKDKNGMEIYEGDIVERRRERGLVDFNSENYGKIPGWNLLMYQYIPYQKEGWIYQEKDDQGELPAIEYYYGCPPDKTWEVIGNIFEGIDK